MDDFLKAEYEQCLSLIKYYDERHQSLVKYASGMSGAIPSLLLAIFNLGNGAEHYFWQFALIIFLVTILSLASIFTVLIQTRLYFIYPVRQVNSIRRHCLKQLKDHDFDFENQMYLNTSFNAFKWLSSHTLLHLFVSMQVGAFAAFSSYAYMVLINSTQCLVCISVVIGALFTSVLFFSSAKYLYQKSKYHPDKSIHSESLMGEINES